jgi:hypothetical protein
MSLSYQANATYPFAISLLESMRLYESTNETVSNTASSKALVAGSIRQIHELLTEVNF